MRGIYIDFVIRLFKPLETNFNRHTRNGEKPIPENVRNPIPEIMIKTYTRKEVIKMLFMDPSEKWQMKTNGKTA